MSNIVDFGGSDITRPCDTEVPAIIGAHGDFHPDELRFLRSMREGRAPDDPLEHSAPVVSWGRTAVEALVFGAFILACIYIGPVLLGVAIDWSQGR